MVCLLEPSRLLLLLCVLTSAVWETTLAECPPGDWQRYNGNCYYPSNTLKTDWTTARQVCRSMGAELTSVEDAAENSFIVENFLNAYYIWVGLNDIAEEGQYSWTDGSTSTYRNWYSAEPSGVDTQNCVIISGGAGAALGEWWDEPCTDELWFMCKMAEY